MFTLNKLMLLAHTEIAEQCNYAIHKKIIGFIKIINCWHTTGGGVQQWATGVRFADCVFIYSGQALCRWADDFLGT